MKNENLWKEHLQNNFKDIYQKDKSGEDILKYINNITYENLKTPKSYTIEEYNKIISRPIP